MENISEHITYKEATYSETAIRKGITNAPSVMQLENMKYIAKNLFEPCRKHFNEPIHINSFFRSISVNHSINGSISSQHVQGSAIDMRFNYSSDTTNAELFHFIKDNLEFDQLIWEFGNSDEPRWVHVSLVKAGNRKQVLVAKRIDGKVRYNTYI